MYSLEDLSYPQTVPFRYEPDENPKQKHRWKKNEPGFLEIRGVFIGKCPANLSLEEAETLLNAGIRWNRPRTPDLGYPDSIYVVYEGAVYRAKPTMPGESYHAFPELPKRLRELPADLRDRILERARELGCETQVRRWINS